MEKGIHLSLEEVNRVADLIKDEMLYGYVNQLITQVEKILDIDPSLTDREILQLVARTVVENFGAEAASIRISDPERKEMISYGSYPGLDENLRRSSLLKIRSPVRWSKHVKVTWSLIS